MECRQTQTDTERRGENEKKLRRTTASVACAQFKKNFLSLRPSIVFVRLNERDLIYLRFEFISEIQLWRSMDRNL